MAVLRKLFLIVLKFLNQIVPKKSQVVLEGYPNIESNVVVIANYLASNYTFPIYYVVNSKNAGDPSKLLDKRVTIIGKRSIKYVYIYLSTKYVFTTHGFFIKNKNNKKQILVNVWHGIPYKKIGKLIGGESLGSCITVATSPLTKKIFHETFGVTEEEIVISGSPRNDQLLFSKANKSKVKSKFSKLNSYSNILIWLPTFRKSTKGDKTLDGNEVGNPFYIDDFNVQRFNEILDANDTLGIIKPHPSAPKYDYKSNLSNLLFIEENWLGDVGITLYELAGISDLLVSDVSSIMIDYLLLDQPIVCVSRDFHTYKENRGFYFEDIQNWIPSRINNNQEEFFDLLNEILTNNMDPYEEKREELKMKFFSHFDSSSTDRLVKYVMKY